MKDFDRFDLEDQIMQCWNVVSDLKVISESIIEGRSACDPDSVYNIVSGVATLYELKFGQLFRIFESLVTEFDEGKKMREGFSYLHELQSNRLKDPERSQPEQALNKVPDSWLSDSELREKYSEHYFQPDRNRPVKTPYPPLNKFNDPERPSSDNPSF
jgi:hypothetical protein